MIENWQTLAALALVAIAAGFLIRSAWRKRDGHEGCDCPGAKTGRELRSLKKQSRR
jgi:hypothetical protein